MNAKKAKALRKQIYGDMSHRTREYLKGHEPKMGFMKPVLNGMYYYPNPTCICTGLRRIYQNAKRS